MDEKQIKQTLEAIAVKEIPDDMNLWSKIEPQLHRRARWLPRTRLNWALAVVALFIMASATVYAVDRLIFRSDAGIEAVNEDINYLNLTRTLEDNDPNDLYEFIVTLHYAYADANRININYTVTGKAPVRAGLQVYSNPTLTDDRGHQFVWLPLGGGGGGGGGPDDPDAIVETTVGMDTNFDASVLTDAPDELNLSLKIEVAYADVEMSQENPNGMIFAGAAVFDFTQPFNAGRVMDTPQTITAGDIEITMQKVVVAPSLTRIELCYADPAPENVIWTPFGRLEVNGETILPDTELTLSGLAGQPLEEDDPCRAIIIPEALHEQTGTWKLTIIDFRRYETNNDEVIRRLREDYDIEVTPLPEGGFTYSEESRATQDISAALQAISAEMAQHIEGPVVFTFTLP